jgi:Uma2 family endonuclease
MSSWPYPDRPKLVCANVGLFSDTEPVVVPDVMLSLDVRRRPLGEKGKRGDSYFIQLHGKAPEVAIEIVSNKVGGEEEKLRRYARLGVRYGIIHDPWHLLSAHDLRAFTLRTDRTARESRSRRRAGGTPYVNVNELLDVFST